MAVRRRQGRRALGSGDEALEHAQRPGRARCRLGARAHARAADRSSIPLSTRPRSAWRASAVPTGSAVPEPLRSAAVRSSLDTYEQRRLRAVVVTRGSVASLERRVPAGRRACSSPNARAGCASCATARSHLTLSPGIPPVVSLGTMAGLMDIALHPRFAENKWILHLAPQAGGHGRRRRRPRSAPRQQRDPASHRGTERR